MKDVVEALVARELDALSLDLVELTLRGSKGKPIVEVRIEQRGGDSVSIEDCAKASRAIEARLDHEGTLGDRYVLEVSSPGIERPLRSIRDWRRFAGRSASVVSPVVGGRAEVEILGVDVDETGAGVALVRNSKGIELRLPLAEVREARLVFHW